MSSLLYKNNSIQNNVIANLQKSIDHLNTAINNANNLSQPYSISASYKINNLASDISTIKSEANQLISWLNQAIRSLESTTTNVTDKITGVNAGDVKQQQQIIN